MKTRVRTKNAYSPDSYLKMSTGIKLWVLGSIIIGTATAIVAKNFTGLLFMILFLNTPVIFLIFLYNILKLITFFVGKSQQITNRFQKCRFPMIETDSWIQRKNNQNYYNIEKLKKDFSKYLFWKNIWLCFIIFFSIFIISFYRVLLFLKQPKDTGSFVAFIGFLSIVAIIFFIIVMKRQLYYIAYKKDIKIHIYSGKPNAYYWSPNGYIDFFRKK